MREEEEERLKIEGELRVAKERVKREELKAMIREIQGEVQAKVTGQVVAMLDTFLGDVGVLLRHLLKGKQSGDLHNETTIGTMRALQALQHFDLAESESDYDTDSDTDSDSDSDQSDSTKGTGRGMKTQYHQTCQCGKAISQYQKGSYIYIVFSR